MVSFWGDSVKKILPIALVFAILFTGCGSRRDLKDEIIKAIDAKCDRNGECTINMSDTTWFKWDRMVVYDESASSESICEALGIAYSYDVGFAFGSGIAFAEGKKVVYKLWLPEKEYDSHFELSEEYQKFRIFIERNSIRLEPNCRGYTPDNAVLTCQRNSVDGGVFHYKITAPLPTDYST